MNRYIELDVVIEELEDRIAPSAPGAIVITLGSGAEMIPPSEISVVTPPPIIAFFAEEGGTGVVLGFHRGLTST